MIRDKELRLANKANKELYNIKYKEDMEKLYQENKMLKQREHDLEERNLELQKDINTLVINNLNLSDEVNCLQKELSVFYEVPVEDLVIFDSLL